MAKPQQKAVMDIDLSELEVECRDHAGLAEDAFRTAADLRLRWEELKIELDVAYAEAEQKRRDNPTKYGLEKITEAAIKAAVELDKKVLRLRKEVIEAKHALDIGESRGRAMEHRKRMIDNLIQLFLAGYFAAPKSQRAKMRPNEVKMPKGVRNRSDDDE